MSAPTSHDPLVVNTADGSCWVRYALTSDGRGLYALAGTVPECPVEVLPTFLDLAEHGIVGSTDVLPVPFGPQMPDFPPLPETELGKLHAERARLQGLLAEAVADAHRARRERDLMRERVSEPYGCAYCGVERRSHGRRYIGGAGMHAWERPSDEQVKDRMLARRVAGMALPSNLSLWEEPPVVAALRARVAELEAERQATNEWVDDAAKALRANRDRIAELEALKPAPIQTCRVCGAGYTFGEPCSVCEYKARVAAELALREVPYGEHYGSVHHSYRLGHDLPETGGTQC